MYLGKKLKISSLKFYNFHKNKIDVIEGIIKDFIGLHKGDINTFE